MKNRVEKMSTSPTPSDTGATGGGSGGDEWRSTVLQSYRNTEVREIANVLAALEPGTTSSSKLMLAMKFEDAIFKNAKSLDDYRKTLTKRLRKLQKKYASGAAAKGDDDKDKNAKPEAATAQQLLLELKHKYGEMLRYIYFNSNKAIEEVKSRQGEERSLQLQQHTDSAKQWALDLGVVEPNETDKKSSSSIGGGAAPSSASTSIATVTKSKSSANLSLEKLLRLQQHLEKRVDNIRSYVVKHANPDLFLQETLIRKDEELPKTAMKLLGTYLTKRMQMLIEQQNAKEAKGTATKTADAAAAAAASAEKVDPISLFNPQELVQISLEKSQINVPPPTRRDVSNIDSHIPAALLHLEKLRSASTTIMSYVATTDRSMAPRGTLTKAHTIAIEAMDFVKDVAQKQREQEEKQLLQQQRQQQQSSSSKPDSNSNKDDDDGDDDDDEEKKKKILTEHDYVVSLEDAWTKVLELPNRDTPTDDAVDDPDLTGDGAASEGESSAATRVISNKRPKINTHVKPVYKSRVLLRPNRKTPPHLLPALRRKYATLVRPPPSGMGSYLVLDFGLAFRMTIYFTPLVVTIRALSEADIQSIKQKKDGSSNGDNNNESVHLQQLSTIGSSSGATWTPLYHGLADAGTFKINNKNNRNINRSSTSTTNTRNETAEKELNVWGVRGSHKVLGHVVEERLRDASNHATYVLRKCFQNSVKDKTVEYEVEILEATALLEFLQLARRTYIPKWQDADQ